MYKHMHNLTLFCNYYHVPPDLLHTISKAVIR